MAIEKVVNINIKDNANDVEKDINSLNQSGKKLEQTFKDVNATFEDVYGELKPLTSRLGEAEDRLYELALAGQQNTQEYKELLKATANYRKVQIQTDLVVDSAAQTMSQKLGGALEGAASGFALVQGAMGLFGSESEEVEKALLKVQSAMALAQGIEGVRTAIPLMKNLGSTAITALKGIQKGIAATGIGLLVVALGTIVAYWDDIKQAVTGVNDEQQKLINDSHSLALVESEKLSSLSKQENSLRLQGKSEKEILEIKLKQIDAVIAATETELKAQQEADKAQLKRVESNNKILKQVARIGLEISSAMLRVLATPLDALIKTINQASKLLGFGDVISFNINDAITKLNKYGSETVASFIFDVDEVRKETEERAKSMNNTITDLKSQRDGMLLEVKKINKQEKEDRIKTAKEIADKEAEIERERKQNLKKLDDEFLNEVEQVESEYYNNKLSNQEREERAVKNKYFYLLNKAEEFNDSLTDLEQEKRINTVTLEEARLAELAAIKKAYDDKAKEEAQKLADEEKAEKDKRLAEEKEALDKKYQMTYDTINALSGLNDLFNAKNEKDARAQFKINKALSLAQASIQTFQAVTGALTAGGNPIKLATGAQFIEAGIAAAIGGANIAKIASTQFGGFGDRSTSTSNVSTASIDSSIKQLSTPNFNVVGASGISQTENLQPVKAYVVSGEVTSAQALDRNRIQNATF